MDYIDKDNVQQFLRTHGIRVQMVYPIYSKHFELLHSIKIVLSNGEDIVIEKGFRFDGSSVPRCLWWIFPSYGDFFLAALIHDWCYINDYKRIEWGTDRAREFADKEMLYWSQLTNTKSIFKTWDNYLRYYAVKWFGKKVYVR